MGRTLLDGPVDAVVIDNALERVMDPDELLTAAVAALRRRVARRDRSQRARRAPVAAALAASAITGDRIATSNHFSADDLARLFERHGLRLRFFGRQAVGALA